MSVGASNGDIKIFCGNSNIPLAQSIAKVVNQMAKANYRETSNLPFREITLGDATVGKFQDGEISIKIGESIRECDVFLVQSTSNPVNEHLMELLIMIDAARRASAKRITAVIPYYGYARQDRKSRARDPISAKLVANLLTIAGADRILTMDLHCAQIQGFFDIPVDHLKGLPRFVEYYDNPHDERFNQKSELIVAAPDLGSVDRARGLAESLNVNLVIVDKRRGMDNRPEVLNIIGDTKGKNVILVDDEIDTGGSITNAAKVIKDSGADKVYVCCTHSKFSGNAFEKINDSPIEELLILDTIPLKNAGQFAKKIKISSVSQLFGEAIYNIHEGRPVSVLFNNL